MLFIELNVIKEIISGFRATNRLSANHTSLALGIILFVLGSESFVLAQTAPLTTEPAVVPVKMDDFTLARRLRNPISSLINLPMIDNLDFGGGPHRNGTRSTLNIEPVIPFTLTEHWKLVSRLTLPFIDQRNIIPGTSQDGLGDTTERLLLSPAKANALGINWGIGSAFLLPTATNDALGFDRWGTGPAVALNCHQGPWTASVLAYQIFSVAGNGPSIDTVTIQPSVSYVFPTDTTLSLSSDSNFDCRSVQYTCPLNITTYQLVKIGDQPVNLGLGVRYYVARPAGAPEWGLRCSVTLAFPLSH